MSSVLLLCSAHGNSQSSSHFLEIFSRQYDRTTAGAFWAQEHCFYSSWWMLWPQPNGAGIRALAGQSYGFILVCNGDFFPLETKVCGKGYG